MTKTKRFIVSFCIVALVVSAIGLLPGVLVGGDLECSDHTHCKSGAKCVGPGSEAGCVLTCDAGPTVDCGKVTEPEG